jgi:hypothetical protein
MILPAFPAKWLIKVVVLAGCGLQKIVPWGKNNLHDIGFSVVSHYRLGQADHLRAELQSEIAVYEANNSKKSVETPNSDEWPEVWLIFALVL